MRTKVSHERFQAKTESGKIVNVNKFTPMTLHTYLDAPDEWLDGLPSPKLDNGEHVNVKNGEYITLSGERLTPITKG